MSRLALFVRWTITRGCPSTRSTVATAFCTCACDTAEMRGPVTSKTVQQAPSRATRTYRFTALPPSIPNMKRKRSSAKRSLGKRAGDLKRRLKRSERVSNRAALAKIDHHWHDLRHEALSRLADDGVPIHELQLLAGHASITTTQRYMNARANSLAESIRLARERRVKRLEQSDEATVTATTSRI